MPAELGLVIRAGFHRRQHAHHHAFLARDFIARIKQIRPPADQAVRNRQIQSRGGHLWFGEEELAGAPQYQKRQTREFSELESPLKDHARIVGVNFQAARVNSIFVNLEAHAKPLEGRVPSVMGLFHGMASVKIQRLGE